MMPNTLTTEQQATPPEDCEGRDDSEEIKIIHTSRWETCVQIPPDGKMSLVVACYIQDGWLQCVKIPFSSFSQSLSMFSDLERLVIDTVERLHPPQTTNTNE
jgi:hypothetical protein